MAKTIKLKGPLLAAASFTLGVYLMHTAKSAWFWLAGNAATYGFFKLMVWAGQPANTPPTENHNV